jgi:ComF family protein
LKSTAGFARKESPAPAAAQVWCAWLRSHEPRFGWLRGALERLLPPTCLFCGEAADLGQVDLCSWCLVALPVPDVAASPRLVAPFAYRAPVSDRIKTLKYHSDFAAARVFGAVLAAAVATCGEPVDAFVPIPLHRSRRAQRGGNQAEWVARAAARWLDVPVQPRLLTRVRATASQAGLRAPARRANVADAFSVVEPRVAPGARQDRLALVDDVLTTGATAAAAARALRAAGWPRPTFCVLARAVAASDLLTHGEPADIDASRRASQSARSPRDISARRARE